MHLVRKCARHDGSEPIHSREVNLSILQSLFLRSQFLKQFRALLVDSDHNLRIDSARPGPGRLSGALEVAGSEVDVVSAA